MIYAVNHVIKRFDRSRGARNQRLCSMLERDKIFRWPPKYSLEHVLLRLEDRKGEYIQGVAS